MGLDSEKEKIDSLIADLLAISKFRDQLTQIDSLLFQVNWDIVPGCLNDEGRDAVETIKWAIYEILKDTTGHVLESKKEINKLLEDHASSVRVSMETLDNR